MSNIRPDGQCNDCATGLLLKLFKFVLSGLILLVPCFSAHKIDRSTPDVRVNRTVRSLSNHKSLQYKVVEESPRGFLVGNILQDLNILLLDGLNLATREQIRADLTITNWRDRAVQLFSLEPNTGHLRVVVPPDRESICPTSAGTDTSVLTRERYLASEELQKIIGDRESDRAWVHESFAPDEPCFVDIRIAFQYKQLTNQNPIAPDIEDPELVTVRVEILDVNDHTPTFPQTRLTAELSEMSPVAEQSVIDIPTAYDPDSGLNGTIIYWMTDASLHLTGSKRSSYDIRMTSSSPSDALPLKLVGNPLRLILIQPLDWEHVKEYNLIISARDCGTPEARSSQIIVHVTVRDENDNVPKFSQTDYVVITNESVQRGTVILELTATDADSPTNGQLTFSFAQPLNAQERVALQHFGLRTLSPNQAAVYVVQAPDVDVVPKRTTSTVAEVHRDFPHRSDVSSSFFQEFTFHVLVKDNGYPRQLSSRSKITVRVFDVNDSPPVILLSYLPPPGTLIPGNVKPEYGHSLLHADQNRGIVMENVNRSFVAFVTVVDLDSGQWGQTQCRTNNDAFVLIPVSETDQNSDTAFSASQFVHIHQDQPVNALTASGETGYKLLAVKPFDREKTSEILFSIICVDNPNSAPTTGFVDLTNLVDSSDRHSHLGSSGSLQLTGTAFVRVLVADENDNPPIFQRSQYTFSIDEADGSANPPAPFSSTPKFIGQVTATDSDHTSKLSYSLQLEDTSYFHLEHDTGKLFSKQQFDREHIFQQIQTSESSTIDGIKATMETDKSIYLLLQVGATDGKYNVTTTVRLLVCDLNDNVPIFDQPNYEFTVPENEQPVKSGALGTVSAHDDDTEWNGRILYKLMDIAEALTSLRSNHSTSDLVSLSSKSFFTISGKTGQLHLIRKLDREQQTHHIFYVLAIDNPGEGQMDTVWTGSNDVNSATIRASSVSHTATATVTVIVGDVNDNAPRITYPPSHGLVNIETGAPAGHNLFTVVAEDPDAGENGTIRFTLTMASYDKPKPSTNTVPNDSNQEDGKPLKKEDSQQLALFSIDSTTGIVFLADKLTDQSASYLLIIGAHDLGRPEQRKVSSTVTIRVQNNQIVQKLGAYQQSESGLNMLSGDQSVMRSGTSFDGYNSDNVNKFEFSGRPIDPADSTGMDRTRLRDGVIDRYGMGQSYGGSGFRGRFLNSTDRTVVIILAIIFALLLMTTIVLVLLIRRRREMEHQRSVMRKAEGDGPGINNSVKVDFVRHQSASNTWLVGPDGSKQSKQSPTDTEFASSLPRIRPVLLQENGCDIHTLGTTASKYGMRTDRRSGFYALDDMDMVAPPSVYERVVSSHLCSPTFQPISGGVQQPGTHHSPSSPPCSNSMELLTLPQTGCTNGPLARNDLAVRLAVRSTGGQAVPDCYHRSHGQAGMSANTTRRVHQDKRYQTIDLLTSGPNEVTMKGKQTQLGTNVVVPTALGHIGVSDIQRVGDAPAMSAEDKYCDLQRNPIGEDLFKMNEPSVESNNNQRSAVPRKLSSRDDWEQPAVTTFSHFSSKHSDSAQRRKRTTSLGEHLTNDIFCLDSQQTANNGAPLLNGASFV